MPSDAASAGLPLIEPAWPGGPPQGVGAAMSTRQGGVSAAPWHSLNLGVAVADDAAAVATNRARFARALLARPVWLRQVHGTRVLRLEAGTSEHPVKPADAAWTTEPGIACTVQVADCLPVLLATGDGRAVAAAHAGWRGLAGGVLEATVAALRDGAGAEPAELRAWLGPCIGPAVFEVGADVLEGFGRVPLPADQPAFRWAPRADGSARWRADLPLLARERLAALGVHAVAVHGGCTVAETSGFFSFRRDGVTGRMAAAVWRRA
ncbi:MAG: peptidoglycan editing factor PgeF [Rubrivivax sp.]